MFQLRLQFSLSIVSALLVIASGVPDYNAGGLRRSSAASESNVEVCDEGDPERWPSHAAVRRDKRIGRCGRTLFFSGVLTCSTHFGRIPRIRSVVNAPMVLRLERGCPAPLRI